MSLRLGVVDELRVSFGEIARTCSRGWREGKELYASVWRKTFSGII